MEAVEGESLDESVAGALPDLLRDLQPGCRSLPRGWESSSCQEAFSDEIDGAIDQIG
jgi:hypothetical protein